MIATLLYACLTAENTAPTQSSITPIEPQTETPSQDGSFRIQPTDLPTSTARNTALIVIDTLRDDALRAADTPNIDSLARQGHRVEHALVRMCCGRRLVLRLSGLTALVGAVVTDGA